MGPVLERRDASRFAGRRARFGLESRRSTARRSGRYLPRSKPLINPRSRTVNSDSDQLVTL